MDSSDDEIVKEELDGDCVVVLSTDMRYIEIQLSSNKTITPDDFMTILEYIVEHYSQCPEKFLSEFGRGLPEKKAMN